MASALEPGWYGLDLLLRLDDVASVRLAAGPRVGGAAVGERGGRDAEGENERDEDDEVEFRGESDHGGLEAWVES
jgi:hypothetical protein